MYCWRCKNYADFDLYCVAQYRKHCCYLRRKIKSYKSKNLYRSTVFELYLHKEKCLRIYDCHGNSTYKKITSHYYMLSNYFRLTNQKIQTISRLTCLKWLTSVLLSCKHKINFLKIRRMDQILHDTVVNRRNTVFIKCYKSLYS